ncbi:MAG: hypothetical protein OQL06_02480 [Gammaproteobacteria bacterium]|nr:hypothetical protein [Gammaproteobacteria bacterium]
MKNITSQKHRIRTTPPLARRALLPAKAPEGLSGLQQATVSLMNQQSRNWGFSGSALKVKRQKIDHDTWQLTVENPKTRKVILKVEGHGDKVFAHEDNLARMAEMLLEDGLKITTTGAD